MLRRFSHKKLIPLSCRLLAHFSQLSRFSSQNSLSEFAQRVFFEETKKLEEEAIFRPFMQNLNRLYLFDQKSQSAKAFLRDNFLKVSLNAKTPLKDILESYQANNRYGFDQEILALSIDYLARTFNSLGKIRVSEDLNVSLLRFFIRFSSVFI